MELIRLNPGCISCLLKSRLEDFPEDTPHEIQIEYMQRVLKAISETPKSEGAPVIVRTINQIQKEMFGYNKDFTHVKSHFNELMLEKAPSVREKLNQSEDSLKLAIQYAMTGNYIDFGAMNNVDEEQLDQLLDQASGNHVDEKEYASLKADIEKARSIVYLTDNCGEIVMDKLLIEEIKTQNPNAQITAIVRGKPVLNDATMEDAIQVGFTEMVNVIGNGSEIAGTYLEEISKEAKDAIDCADVIFAKGQGNFETLRMCGKNIYYIFMCKCEMFAKRFQVPKYYGMLINDKNL
jgi:uncharacterized protein with ATP-grasp and redox domains